LNLFSEDFRMDRREFATLAALAPWMAPSDSAPRWQAFAVLADAAPAYNIGDGSARILVDTARSAGAWWLGSFVSDAGRKTSLHLHHSADEQFFVIEGVLSFWLGGRWIELPAGAAAAVPRGTPHALGNRSSHPVRFVGSGNPAGFENFFRDIAELVKRLPYASPAFLAELRRLYPKYDSELLGAPPAG
jgi:mannose-6-phosphate isomerase-like protein (cupin superfamily)